MSNLSEEAKKEAAEKFAQKYSSVSRKSEKKRSRQIMLQGFLLVILIVAALLFFLVGITHTSGNSMYPTYHDGQLIFFFKQARNYDRGDVVALDMTSGDDYIKRIVAVPGDTVEIQYGQFILNGKVQDEPYAATTTNPEAGNVKYPLTLKDGEYFVMGDNRAGSSDSRAFGPIVRGQIKGKVIN